MSDVRAVTEGSRRVASVQTRWVLAVVALAIVAASLSAGYQAAVRGVDRLTWDECEYLDYTLKSYDKLEQRGVVAWPVLVAARQHYAKPTLLVNAMIPAVWIAGRDNLDPAIGLFFGLAVAGMLIVVAVMARALYSPRSMLPAVLVVGAMPALGFFSRSIFPTLLLCGAALVTVGVLFWPGKGLARRRAILFGLVVGLGLMAKITYPAVAVGPLILWLVWERREDPWGLRVRFLVLAAVIAVAVAGPWYLDNWRRALGHATMSFGWTNQEPQSSGEIICTWLDLLFVRCMGASVSLLILATIGLWWWRRQQGKREPREAVVTVAFCAAALPLLVAAMTSVNIMDRFVLPALVCIAFAAAGALGRMRLPPAGRAVRGFLVCLVAAQFAVLQAGWVVRAARAGGWRMGSVERVLDPYARRIFQRIDQRPADDVFAVLEELARDAEYPRCLLLTDSAELNVFRLRMMNRIRQAPFFFDWGSYFSWPEDQVQRAIRRAGETPSLLVWYRPLSGPMHRGDILNRYAARARAAVGAEDSGFALWRQDTAPDGTYEIEYYRNFGDDGGSTWTTVLPVQAEFDGRIRIDEIAVGEGRISVACTCLDRVERSFHLLIHASPAGTDDGAFESWDRPIQPPTSVWRPGGRYRLEYQLDRAQPGIAYRLVLGFFEEIRGRNRWRRMPRSDVQGEDSLTVVVTPLEMPSATDGSPTGLTLKDGAGGGR